MMFSLGSWFGGSLLFADLFILLLLTMKSWSTWDVWNWFSQTTHHSQLLQKCPLPQKFRWLGIQKIHPWKRAWRHGNNQAFQVEDIYLQLKISIKTYIRLIFYGAMLVFSGVLHWSQDPKAPRKALSPKALRVPRNGPQRPRCRCMSWRPCTMWGRWEMSWSKFSGKLERAGWWVGGFPVMMLVLSLFLDAFLFVSQFHHGCDALTALLLYRSLAGVGCLTVQYQRPSWFLRLAYLLILEHFLNRWLLMLVSIESKVCFHPIGTVWISSGCVICESRNNNQDVYSKHK